MRAKQSVHFNNSRINLRGNVGNFKIFSPTLYTAVHPKAVILVFVGSFWLLL